MLALGTLAVIAALAWLAEHVLVLAGVALLIGGAYYLGQRHGRRQARPGQIQTRQALAGGARSRRAMPAGTLPQADYDWDEPGTRSRPVYGQVGQGPGCSPTRFGAHPLRRP